jgi:hypothetical protein
MATRDMGIAEVLAHHRAVFGLGQGIIVGASGAGFGEFLDVQLFQQGGDAVVDVLRTIDALLSVKG